MLNLHKCKIERKIKLYGMKVLALTKTVPCANAQDRAENISWVGYLSIRYELVPWQPKVLTGFPRTSELLKRLEMP